MLQADRARDTGRYTIKLVCEAGTFEASANVNVLDVPSKCRCMHVDEVRAEHVKLSWAVPEDDGGTPITSYLVRYWTPLHLYLHISTFISTPIYTYLHISIWPGTWISTAGSG